MPRNKENYDRVPAQFCVPVKSGWPVRGNHKMNTKAIDRMGLEKAADPSGIMAEAYSSSCWGHHLSLATLWRIEETEGAWSWTTSTTLISRLICQFQKMIPLNNNFRYTCILFFRMGVHQDSWVLSPLCYIMMQLYPEIIADQVPMRTAGESYRWRRKASMWTILRCRW